LPECREAGDNGPGCDKDLIVVQARLFYHLTQEFPGPPDEGPASLRLFPARRLSDKDSPRIRTAFAWHRLPRAAFFTEGAVCDFLSNGPQYLALVRHASIIGLLYRRLLFILVLLQRHLYGPAGIPFQPEKTEDR